MLRRELGRGFSFPIRIDRRGRIAFSEGQQKVAEAIRIVLETRIGERVMRSRFGSEVPAILFEPATSSTADRLESAIRDALVRWEPRIDVIAVEVTVDPAQASRFIASLTYRLRENNALLNQVYPFYLTEGSEDQ
jgi:phage baseplate assembly protein W